MLRLDPTDGVPENHGQMKHRELNPTQSSQTAQSLATPDVNTCRSFAYGNEEDDSKTEMCLLLSEYLCQFWELFVSLSAKSILFCVL